MPLNQLKLISHRGNLNGPSEPFENRPQRIEECIELGFDVEIDLRMNQQNELRLGHDLAEYLITIKWLINFSKNLWIHCKDSASLEYLRELNNKNLNYFYHSQDRHTLTSKGFIWSYPQSKILKNSILVLPENFLTIPGTIKNYPMYGICSDYIEKFK